MYSGNAMSKVKVLTQEKGNQRQKKHVKTAPNGKIMCRNCKLWPEIKFHQLFTNSQVSFTRTRMSASRFLE